MEKKSNNQNCIKTIDNSTNDSTHSLCVAYQLIKQPKLNYRSLPFDERLHLRRWKIKASATDIHDIFVNGQKCREAKNAGLVVQGFPDKKVHDVYFNNVTIDKAPIGVSFTNAENIVMDNVTIGGEVKEPSAAK